MSKKYCLFKKVEVSAQKNNLCLCSLVKVLQGLKKKTWLYAQIITLTWSSYHLC